MKRFLPILAMLLLSQNPCVAQIAMSATLDRGRYAEHEQIKLEVTLRNNSGNTVVFGDANKAYGSLSLEINDNTRRGVAARTQKHFNPVALLTLPPGATRSLEFSINSYYDCRRPGNYDLTVRIKHDRFAMDYVSKPAPFEILEGVLFWKTIVGVPESATEDLIRTREAIVFSMNGDEGHVQVLRIQDKDHVYGVIRLGPKIDGGKDEFEVDARSHIHALCQVAPRAFRYLLITVNGELKQERVYIVEGSMPKLIRDPDVGQVIVVGGKIGIEGIDYNAPTELKRPFE